MPRIRDFGITPGYLPPGPLNAITDVTGVRVGHTTVNRDVNGVPWRTGVTAIWPHAGNPLPHLSHPLQNTAKRAFISNSEQEFHRVGWS